MSGNFLRKEFWASLDQKKLIEILNDLRSKATEVIKNSYSPYSRFKVASCVFTNAGTFWGVNVENASYGLTICAERNAIFSAVTAGAREVYAVFIFTEEKLAPPCGACRQVIFEFGKDALVISSILNAPDGFTNPVFRSWNIKELLPGAFEF